MANETTKRLMGRVKQIRLARGLTQEQFAERADLDPKYYQHAEAGRKPNPGLETLEKLAKACGLELWELLNFDAVPSTIAVAEDQTAYEPSPASRKAPRKTPKPKAGKKV